MKTIATRLDKLEDTFNRGKYKCNVYLKRYDTGEIKYDYSFKDDHDHNIVLLVGDDIWNEPPNSSKDTLKVPQEEQTSYSQYGQ